MSFDMDPDHDTHGECRREIQSLQAKVEQLEKRVEAEYQRGLEEGASGQAIKEIHGRERFLAELKTDQTIEIERLQTSADRLAYTCAQAVMQGTIGSRSAIGDALLQFLQVGGIDGPKTVPEWMAAHKAAQGGE